MSSVSTRATQIVAIACAVALAACASDPAAQPTSAPPASSAGASSAAASSSAIPSASAAGRRLDRRPRRVIFENVTGEPDWPLEGFGSVWALTARPGGAGHPPARPGDERDRSPAIPLPGQRCQGFTVSDDAVWACVTGGVVRIDPETNAITDEVPFETAQVWSRLAFGGGSVWAIGAADGSAESARPHRPRGDDSDLHPARPWRHEPGLRLRRGLGQRFPGRACPAGRPGHRGGDGARHRSRAADRSIVAGPDSLWATLFGSEEPAPDEPTVVRIDPTDGSAVTEIATGAASLGKGGLWADRRGCLGPRPRHVPHAHRSGNERGRRDDHRPARHG